jgi:transcriptional regulator with XRE-family HTH domain
LVKTTKKADEQWQKAFAKHLKQLIKEKGYTSAYDFWVQECGEHISRANLDNILNGRVDPKASTLRKLAESLDISFDSLVDFQE